MQLEKCPTGIEGFDEITGGGVPAGRPTLVCGGAGCGKTLFGMEFLVKGATRYGEPGVFIAFEENEKELADNVGSLNWDLDALVAEKKIFLDHVHIERSEIEETGEFNLDGLFIRIEAAVQAVKAKRITIDTIEALFSGFTNEATLRAEIRRMFRWLKNKGLTAVITGEQGAKSLTRHGLEEYVSDCVVFLDHRMVDQIATRRLRVVKYRGSSHGTNEYPFLIDAKGVSVVPVTALGLDYNVSTERIPTGVARLDTMLGGQGFYRNSSILVSGTAGTGKSSLAAYFLNATCKREERALYFSFEEPPQQIIRNMGSIGIDLERWVKKGALLFRSLRVTTLGLEMHLAVMLKTIQEFKPQVVVIDPISNFHSIGSGRDAKTVLTRLIDYMKTNGITSMFTDLAHGRSHLESTETEISSLMDTWILLRDIEQSGERNRGLYILKSRGMAHSNQIREFLITENGLDLIDIYSGPEGVLTGTARVAQEARESAQAMDRTYQIERIEREIMRKKRGLKAQLSVVEDTFQRDIENLEQSLKEIQQQQAISRSERSKLGKMRGKD